MIAFKNICMKVSEPKLTWYTAMKLCHHQSLCALHIKWHITKVQYFKVFHILSSTLMSHIFQFSKQNWNKRSEWLSQWWMVRKLIFGWRNNFQICYIYFFWSCKHIFLCWRWWKSVFLQQNCNKDFEAQNHQWPYIWTLLWNYVVKRK